MNYRTTVGQLTALGFEVLATFTSPHFTAVMPTLDLVNAFGRLLPNPYAEGPKEEP